MIGADRHAERASLSTRSGLRALVILAYSLAMTALAPLLHVAQRFHPKLRQQLAGRRSVAELSRELAKPRAAKRRCVVFFCSSAGEYEQARPLLERLTARQDVFVHVIFFSRSGLDFARARGETVSASLSPALDSVWTWGRLLSALRPDVVVVVRHELWPAFLETARHFARLYLINASQSLGETASGWKRVARGQLLRVFDRVFVVSAADDRFFRDTYGLPPRQLVVAGDTKYDRVLERAAARQTETTRYTLRLGGDAATRLILGSAHRPDVELWLAAWGEGRLGADTAGWQVVVAPHHVDAEMIAWIKMRCAAAGLATSLFSDLTGADDRPDATRPQVVVVDAMGVLAELYGTGALAFVGGAVHHQVHNVLEPACRGLALAFGPLYKSSQEAVHLVSAGLAAVCGEPDAFAAWWRRHRHGDDAYSRDLAAEVARLGGATDRILDAWDWPEPGPSSDTPSPQPHPRPPSPPSISLD